jgi:hypothetical protein
VAEVGVIGKGPVGVRGESNVNSDKSIGVRGEGNANSDKSIGVLGHSEAGTGIVGQSEKGNAGSFSSKHLAQIHLEPLSISTPVGTVPGKGGDLLATKDGEGSTTLWFCVGDGDVTTAVWKQIA